MRLLLQRARSSLHALYPNTRPYNSTRIAAYRSEQLTMSELWDKEMQANEVRAQDKEGQDQKPSKRSMKLRGHPRDTEDMRISKTLSWILRHGAKSEGLYMRPDGYVRVQDLLKLPRMSNVDILTLERLVQQDAKMRYHLLFENGSSSVANVWWIRANQGHSMKSVELEMTPLTDSGQVPMAVHGTSLKAWNIIAKDGLSRMTRNHIHLAQGIAGVGVVSGMRKSSQVLIFVDLEKALRAGLSFFVSSNGVVLTEGDDRGYIMPEYFKRVERANRQPFSGWEGANNRQVSPKRRSQSPPALQAEGHAQPSQT